MLQSPLAILAEFVIELLANTARDSLLPKNKALCGFLECHASHEVLLWSFLEEVDPFSSHSWFGCYSNKVCFPCSGTFFKVCFGGGILGC